MKKKEKRMRQILQILESHPQIHINTLQNLTHFSVSSLRRDLVDLEKRGLIQRSFGKIKLLNQENLEYTWAFRANSNVIAKQKIGEIAASFVQDHDAIFIDSSTTAINLLDYLDDLVGLKVITNNLKAAEKIQTLPQVSGFIAGGQLRTLSQTVIGIDANNYLEQFHARQAFISSSTIDENGLYMADVDQTQIKRTMIEDSTIVLALLDHSKFTDHNNFVKLCNLDALDYVITDKPIPEGPTLTALKQANVDIVYKRIGNIVRNKY